MKYAVLSDIHANYEALMAVLKKAEELGAVAYVFCGDLVGYGPDPERCTQAVKKLKNFLGVMGNHDYALTHKDAYDWFSDYAKISLRYTLKNLSDSSLTFINTFHKSFQGIHFAAVHGSFVDPLRDYLLSANQFMRNLPLWKGSLAFVGHSHIPFIMSYSPELNNNKPKIDVFLGKDVTIKMQPNVRYIINPGSIGQPRDANCLASFGLVDTKQSTFRLVRVEYNIAAVQRRMRHCGLPELLYSRLQKGS
ncbi:MAG: metallophosphatase family protein [Elusimicrobiaceae bacterium]|nr:metallophosphatase family protein [Elusimicrobiaceae bacterium]